ncbi:MerR family copper efflux transcriptional regulator [Rossellomorea marisflavi]
MTVRGKSFGTEKLKIGELAELANVTKRTIDHYTNIGILKVERSPSNYRYYDISCVNTIREVNDMKSSGMSLDMIRKKMIEKDTEEIDVRALRWKLKDLNTEVTEILNHKELSQAKKDLSKESQTLIQSLLLLLN